MIPDVTLPGFKPGEKLEPKELAIKVQAMFMEVMIKAMEDSVQAEEGLFGGSASSEIYRGMIREEFATAMSRQLTGPLERQLEQKMTTPQNAATPETPETHESHESHISSVLPVDGVISSKMGWRQDPINGQRRYHGGIDIAAPQGTVIKAVEGGKVIESGVKGGYGNTVVIQTDDGRKMLYAHNNANYVRVGDRVNSGEAIAEVGATGRATGPHVHFEVKF